MDGGVIFTLDKYQANTTAFSKKQCYGLITSFIIFVAFKAPKRGNCYAIKGLEQTRLLNNIVVGPFALGTKKRRRRTISIEESSYTAVLSMYKASGQ